MIVYIVLQISIYILKFVYICCRPLHGGVNWNMAVSAFAEDISNVAPYMGAWIETEYGRSRRRWKSVAPYMGAWIETYINGGDNE